MHVLVLVRLYNGLPAGARLEDRNLHWRIVCLSLDAKTRSSGRVVVGDEEGEGREGGVIGWG
jgi:hypothetical protein